MALQTSLPSSTNDKRAEAYAAIEAHYRAHYKRLVNQSIGRTLHASRACAEDAVQEAYTVALENWEVQNGSLPAWIETILRNCLYDQRAEQRPKTSPEEATTTAPAAYWSTRLGEVKRLIESKDPDTAYLLSLVFLYQYPYRKVALLTRETEANIRKIVQRFREEMAAVLR